MIIFFFLLEFFITLAILHPFQMFIYTLSYLANTSRSPRKFPLCEDQSLSLSPLKANPRSAKNNITSKIRFKMSLHLFVSFNDSFSNKESIDVLPSLRCIFFHSVNYLCAKESFRDYTLFQNTFGIALFRVTNLS